MRGKVTGNEHCKIAVRITPAYAGKSVHDRHNAIHCWDHPRLCGEKVSLRAFAVPLLGSPPPMRGKDHVCDEVTKHFRITPAYAGKSLTSEQRDKVLEDHPRLCGEKFQLLCHGHKDQGSPPPMRGKGSKSLMIATCFGITPAYAGKRKKIDVIFEGSEDHPRLCGEKFASPAPRVNGIGSPPPMRGKEVEGLAPPAGTRITPAYAGKRLLLFRRRLPA